MRVFDRSSGSRTLLRSASTVLLALLALWPLRSTGVAQSTLTAGNLLIVRVGSGAAALSNAAQAVFLDEYTTAGTLVRSVPLPTAGSGANRALTMSGTATSEGALQRSTDRRFITLAGYSAAPGAASIASSSSATVPRVIGVVDQTAAVAGSGIDTTTALNYSSGNNVRGAVSTNGSDLWVVGAAGGVSYTTLGATTQTQLSTTVTNLRVPGIVDGQLHVSSSSGTTVRLGAVGFGMPTTSGQTIANLPGLPTSTGSPYGFFFADLSPLVAGLDTLFVADDGAGILKYSNVGGTWIANGTIGGSSDAYRGLTGTISGSTVTLFATGAGGSGSTGGGKLVRIVDASGFNAVPVTTISTLATAATNTAFRGVAFAPDTRVAFVTQPAGATVAPGTVVTLFAVADGPAPLSYQWYQGVSGDASAPIAGATGTTLTTPALSATTDYWVRATAGFASADSVTATVTVNSQQTPTIVTGPQSQAIAYNTTTVLSVSATGGGLSYQWYRGASGDTTTPVGTNASTFTTPALTATTSYWVRVSNSVGSADSSTAVITVQQPVACSTTPTPIHTVQGTTDISPLAGTIVSIRGVVVGDFEGPSPALRGFYLQEQTPDADPLTSEGVFVFEGSNADTVSVGQVVQVAGTVSEFQGQTQVSASTIESCGSTATVVPTVVALPVSSATYLERFEGMLVQFTQPLYVTEHFQLGRFGEVVLSSAGRLSQPTNVVAPGAAAQALQASNDLNRIVLDDATNDQNRDPIAFGRGGLPLSASNTLRGGDSVTGLVGVMTYTWAGNAASDNAYRIRPIGALGGGVPNFQPANPRPSGSPALGGRLKVASFNVLNYFLTTGSSSICGPLTARQQCRGAENATELARQQAKLNQALVQLGADVVGMMELENTETAAGVDVNPPADIVARLNATVGAGTYASIDTGIIGTDAIRVGLIYRPAAVTPVGSPMIDANPVHNRPSLAQTFVENLTGEKFTVVINHLKSKGSCPSSGADADLGDGQSCWSATRVQQALALLSFVSNTVIPTSGDPDVLLLGDFNSYAKEDPIVALQNGGFVNLVDRYAGAGAYSYAFDGQWGYLDQGLANATLAVQVTGASDYHINADEPSVLDYNTNFKSAGQVASLYNADEFRTSDHDPVVVGLNLRRYPQAVVDTYTWEAGASVLIPAGTGLLSNDQGGQLSVISVTQPAHGHVTVNADGSFTYTPDPGHVGPDSFTYTATNSVALYHTTVAPLDPVTPITGGGYGSAIAPVPGTTDQYYGLTDRGPNVDGPNGTKVEPFPSFTPNIGRFQLLPTGEATLLNLIPLKGSDGTPFSGRVNTLADTGETITDLNGVVLAKDPNGFDSEGLVALPDGTFWVSDEYGPFIAHFDSTGREIGRLSPYDGSLPVELRNRVVNRGMEGLTVTPDGSMLVGIMQSSLQQGDLAGFDARKLTPLRIVTYRFSDQKVSEYLYLLDNPNTTKTAVSEITALSNTSFLVLERDGNLMPGAYKKLYRIDLTGATDVGPSHPAYAGANGGVLISGKTIELFVKNLDTAQSQAALVSAGVTPVSKSLSVDLGSVLVALDAQGRIFGHDKLEGIAVIDNGRKIVVSNDSDFGIDAVTNTTAPFTLHVKTTPAGVQDDGEFLIIDLTKLPPSLSTTTVFLTVQDTVAPDTTIVSRPASSTTATTASFGFSGTDGGSGVARFECALDTQAFASCASPASFGGLLPGSHTFSVRAMDAVGNVDPTPATYAWTVLATATDVSAQVQITYGGFTLNRATGRFVQLVTLKNTGAALSGPVSLVLTNLAGATLVLPTGTTTAYAPGSPYKDIATTSMAAGAQVSVTLEFTRTGTGGITYAGRVLAGSGVR